MIYLFLGKGGVGKSTATARFARRFLQLRRPVIALSLDPSHGLSFYLRDLQDHPDLTLLSFDGPAAAARAIQEHGTALTEILASGTLFHARDIAPLLTQKWPGADEWLGASHLVDLADSADSDTVLLVDMAPGPHARQFLAAPHRAAAWIHFLDALMERHRYLRQRLGSSAPQVDPLESHLADMKARQSRMASLFSDSLRAVLVATPDEDALHTARLLEEDLQTHGVHLDRLLLNRFHHHQQPALGDAFSICPRVEIWPDEAPTRPAPRPHRPSFPLASPESLTIPTRGLHFISGKGGTGKSRLARHIARDLCQQQLPTGIIALSDEGHGELNETSDSDLLKIHCIRPDAEVDSLMTALRAEWSRALRPPAGLSLPFEEEVVDRLLALHPPGFEVLSIALAIGSALLDDPHRVWVIDGPATGHLLRLWDILDAGEAWLNAVLTLLESQQGILALPRMTRRLLHWRRGLRRFLALMADPATGHFWITCLDAPVALSQAHLLTTRAQRQGWHLQNVVSFPSASSAQLPTAASRPIPTEVSLG